jgi:trehalose-6-phosphatase
MRHIRMLLCDIDGTLTGANGRGHSARLLPLMRQLMARGVKIGVVSGRDALSALSVHRLFDLNGPIIGENGAEVILDPLKDEWCTRLCGGLSSSQRAALMRTINRRGLLEHFTVDPGKKRMLTLVPRSVRPHEPEALPAWSRKLQAALKQSLSDVEISYSSAAIDICARGTNKGQGIALACRALATAPGALAFVGDSNNDQTAFEFVRYHRGWLGFVGADLGVKESLQDYPRAYFPSGRASEGSAQFIRFLLKRALTSKGPKR